MGWRSAPVRVPGVNGLVTRTETCRNATCRITSAIRTGLACIDMCEFVAEVAKGLLGLRYSLRRCNKARSIQPPLRRGRGKSLTMPRCVGTGVLTQLRRGGMSCRRGIMTGRYLRAHARCLSLARARGGRGGDERAARACALLVAEVPDARAFKLALWIPETPIGADRGSLPAYLRVPSVDLRELGSSCGTSACLTLACCYESDHTVGRRPSADDWFDAGRYVLVFGGPCPLLLDVSRALPSRQAQ
jgi:hypothetical protein